MTHQHKFIIERAIGNDEGYVTAYDMACECGLKMFVADPSIHRGDEGERRIKFNDDL